MVLLSAAAAFIFAVLGFVMHAAVMKVLFVVALAAFAIPGWAHWRTDRVAR